MSHMVNCCVSLSMLLPLCPPPCVVQHATDEASYLISQADRDGDGRVSECCVVGGGGDSVCVRRTDREQTRSRINNNDCRTFRPPIPLSTAYKTKETVV